ncbi:NAD(P)/FAD-dependent oxidoreductase [Phormidesmis priestleyi]
MENLDVVVVGAGAAGVGFGAVLSTLLPDKSWTILERDRVGASFQRWNPQMRFISPSFHSNPFGLMDLNSIALGTSPAASLGKEHPTGQDYARYLQRAAEYFKLPVQTGIDVKTIEPLAHGFRLHTSHGEIQTRFVVWAAGEFQHPRLNPFPGSQFCQHNALITNWKQLKGDEYLVIGGYESGMDAAFNLCLSGKRVKVLDRSAKWNNIEADPSVSLSPYTRERIASAMITDRIELISDAEVIGVEKREADFRVYDSSGRVWDTPNFPILATGFESSLKPIAHLFEWDQSGHAILSSRDESTVTPGLFVVGSSVRHGDIIFCFIYKFRQRFAVVADEIGKCLGVNTYTLELNFRPNGMFLDDLSCCGDDCVC